MSVRERQEDPEEVTAQTMCLSPAARGFTFVCNVCVCLFKVLCTSGKDQAVSSACVCESAVVSACVDLCGLLCLCVYIHTVYMCLYMLYWAYMLSLTSFPPQPGGVGGMELWQSCHCQAARFSNHQQNCRHQKLFRSSKIRVRILELC